MFKKQTIIAASDELELLLEDVKAALGEAVQLAKALRQAGRLDVFWLYKQSLAVQGLARELWYAACPPEEEVE